MEETVIILTHVNNNDSPYCSFVHEHAKGLQKAGKRVIVLAVVNWFPFVKRIKKHFNFELYKGIKQIDNIEIRYIKRFSISNLFKNSSINFNGIFYYLAIYKTFKKILAEREVVLIDAHTYRVEGYAAYRLKKKYKIKTFVTLHGTSFNQSFNNEKGKKEIKKISKIIDCYICVSDKIKRQLSSLKINNAKVIYNGVVFHKIKRANENKNIITIGSFDKNKNIDIIIDAFEEIKKIYLDSKLTIIGRGKLEKELKEKVKKSDIKDVCFLGYLKNKEVYEKLSNSSIFVLASKPEGFGIVYIEAMYCGCIPIGTIGEGIDGFIKNYDNGFLVNPLKEEIVEKITHIFENNCEYIRKKAINSVEKLSWENNANNYILLYKEVK